MRQPLSDKVREVLLQRIVDGSIKPGAFIDRKQLADELKLSNSPVSEAIRSLEIDGFIQTIPRRGSFICTTTPDTVFSHMMIREALECQGARLYCGEMVKKAGLLPLAKEIDGILQSETERRKFVRWEREKEVHLALMDLAGLEILTMQLERILNLYFFFEVNSYIPYLTEKRHGKHVDLIKGLQNPDPNAAEAEMRRQLRMGREDFIQHFRQSPSLM